MTLPFGIRLRQVSKAYAHGATRVPVLDGLDWQVPPGRLTVLFGASGSGKSTLINLLAGLDQPDAGRITFQRQKETELEWQELDDTARTRFRLQHIGVVYQFFNLLPMLTVLENVLLPLQLAGLSQDKRAHAEKLLDEVGLRDRASALPSSLSGGEQQRVAIVRALANEPSLILADEPTGNLDAKNRAAVIDLMVRLCRSRQTTLLVATHASDWLEASDGAAMLENGRMVAVQ